MACEFKRQRICRTYRQPTVDSELQLQFRQVDGEWRLELRRKGGGRTCLSRAQAITLRNTLTQLCNERNWNG